MLAVLVVADRCAVRFTVSWPHADCTCNKRANRICHQQKRDREKEKDSTRETEREKEEGLVQLTNWPTG